MGERIRFGTFMEAFDFYVNDAETRYRVIRTFDPGSRSADLARDEYEADPSAQAHVVIWPAKDWRGNEEPAAVWAEEY